MPKRYRAVPVPPALLEALDLVHGILQGLRGNGRGVRLWPWGRMTGWRAVHAVMEAAELDGPHASPKGRQQRDREPRAMVDQAEDTSLARSIVSASEPT